jgi:hypothetical protein
MKKLVLPFGLVFMVSYLSAQLALDKKYDFSASVIKLETIGYKYYLMDVPNGQCRLYNSDHSLYKTINCGVPSGFYLYDITNISEKLFDTDAGLEVVCTYYKYIPTASSYYYMYNSKILNDDGSALLSIDGALYNIVKQTGSNTWKLFSYCYDYSVSPEKVWTNIYNLPGTPVLGASFNSKASDFQLSAWPNPAAETVKVAYALPENVKSGTLNLFDSGGRLVKKFWVDTHTDHLELDVSLYGSGTYYFFIECEGVKTESKKLVIR